MTRSTIDYGIDLGTTSSAIAVINGVGVDILKNKFNADITPSVVAMCKTLYVGESGAPFDATTASPVSEEFSKGIFGALSAVDEDRACAMSERALELSILGRLSEAADLMEDVFNCSLALRKKYETRVKLWRRGIRM